MVLRICIFALQNQQLLQRLHLLINLALKAAPTITGPANGDVSGRKITISAITDGSVSANGTAAWVALTDDSGSLLLAAQALNSTQVVSSGNEFTLTAFDIEYPDPNNVILIKGVR